MITNDVGRMFDPRLSAPIGGSRGYGGYYIGSSGDPVKDLTYLEYTLTSWNNPMATRDIPPTKIKKHKDRIIQRIEHIRRTMSRPQRREYTEALRDQADPRGMIDRMANRSRNEARNIMDVTSREGNLSSRQGVAIPPELYAEMIPDFLAPKPFKRVLRQAEATGQGVQSPWIKYVKAYQSKHGCSYKEALKEASKSY